MLVEINFNNQLFLHTILNSNSAFQHHFVPLWTAVPALFPITRSCPAQFCMEGDCCDMLRKCAEVQLQLMVAECFSILQGKLGWREKSHGLLFSFKEFVFPRLSFCVVN